MDNSNSLVISLLRSINCLAQHPHWAILFNDHVGGWLSVVVCLDIHYIPGGFIVFFLFLFFPTLLYDHEMK